MTEPAKDFWARADRDLLARWPKDDTGAPETAAKLDDVASLGKVLGGFASQGVEIWVPASRLEEAQALLAAPAEETSPEQD